MRVNIAGQAVRYKSSRKGSRICRKLSTLSWRERVNGFRSYEDFRRWLDA